MGKEKDVRLKISSDFYEKLKRAGSARGLTVPAVAKSILYGNLESERIMEEHAKEFKDVFEKIAPDFMEKMGAEMKSKRAAASKAKRKPAR